MGTVLPFAFGTIIAVEINTFLAQLVFAPLATGALVYCVFKALRGEETPTVLRSLTLATRRLLTLVVAGLITIFLIGLGLMLFFFPGVILMTGLFLFAPVVMVEKAGPIEALQRSWELSEGYRFALFGVIVVTWLAHWLLGLGVAVIVGGVLPGSVLAASLLAFLIEVLSAAVKAVVAAVAYHDIRMTRDELGEQDLLAAFE